MSTRTMERPMGRKRSAGQPARDDIAVKFDRTLADKAKLVASRKGLTLAEYLTEMTRAAIERDFARVIKDMGAKE
jgi:hypothetical protein